VPLSTVASVPALGGFGRKNRGPLLIALGLLLLIVITAMLSNEEKGDGSPSSYSVLNRGGKAAYLFLLQSGHPVERWEQAPDQLPKDPSGVTLILADPEQWLDIEERSAISRFVLNGGKLLVTGSYINGLLHHGEAIMSERRIGFERSKPVAPSSLTRGGEITQDGAWIWSPASISQMVHYVDAKGNAVVVSYALGKGEVIWWASALPLTNIGIRDAGNLELLLASVSPSRRILWDEYFHTQHKRIRAGAYVKVLRWGVLQLALLMLVLLVTYSRRSGPVVNLPAVSRLSPLEFVASMGAVFHKAKSPQIAVEIALERLQQVAARRLGIPAKTDAGEVARMMLERGYTTDKHMESKLSNAQRAAFDYELTENAAAEHVRNINRALAALEPCRSKER
jgi:hypothetical protein